MWWCNSPLKRIMSYSDPIQMEFKLQLSGIIKYFTTYQIFIRSGWGWFIGWSWHFADQCMQKTLHTKLPPHDRVRSRSRTHKQLNLCFLQTQHPSIFQTQHLVHPKDHIPWHQRSNLVYAIQCSEECTALYVGETKQPRHRHTAQHRRAISSG